MHGYIIQIWSIEEQRRDCIKDSKYRGDVSGRMRRLDISIEIIGSTSDTMHNGDALLKLIGFRGRARCINVTPSGQLEQSLLNSEYDGDEKYLKEQKGWIPMPRGKQGCIIVLFYYSSGLYYSHVKTCDSCNLTTDTDYALAFTESESDSHS
jgi:hypothetical protein